MSGDLIVCEDLSKFYGEVLGVNHVSLHIEPGVTALVGPNGAGKTTLLNLLTGLVRPTRGRLSVLGLSAADPVRLFRVVGYCTQFDTFPPRCSGIGFLTDWLALHGLPRSEARRFAGDALERVGLADAAGRKVAAYSKGMRQRLRLAQAISHRPRVLVLDEPLNGLDPMARSETLALFEALGRQGMHVIVSSHILHEIDRLAARVILLSGGYVVAEGQIAGVRSEVTEHPMQMLVRCRQPQSAGLAPLRLRSRRRGQAPSRRRRRPRAHARRRRPSTAPSTVSSSRTTSRSRRSPRPTTTCCRSIAT